MAEQVVVQTLVVGVGLDPGRLLHPRRRLVGGAHVLRRDQRVTVAGADGELGQHLLDAADVNGTYDLSDGDLVINGKNFRSTTLIEMTIAGGSVGGNFTVDPNNPPAGVTFNAAGTQITISNGSINAAWIGIADAGIIVTTVDVLSPTIGKVGTTHALRGVQTQP